MFQHQLEPKLDELQLYLPTTFHRYIKPDLFYAEISSDCNEKIENMNGGEYWTDYPWPRAASPENNSHSYQA